MKLYTTWLVVTGGPRAAFRYFERRRVVTMTRLAAVTREIRAALDARALF